MAFVRPATNVGARGCGEGGNLLRAPSLRQTSEQFQVQELVPEPTVEDFDAGALHQCSQPNGELRNTLSLKPVSDILSTQTRGRCRFGSTPLRPDLARLFPARICRLEL